GQVTDDVNVGLRVAGDAERVVDLLGQANGIDLPADASDAGALLAPVGIRVREVNRRVARVLGGRGGPVANGFEIQPGIEAVDLQRREVFRRLVVRVGRSRHEAPDVRRRVLVPDASTGLVAEIFRFELGPLVPVGGRVTAEV